MELRTDAVLQPKLSTRNTSVSVPRWGAVAAGNASVGWHWFAAQQPRELAFATIHDCLGVRHDTALEDQPSFPPLHLFLKIIHNN